MRNNIILFILSIFLANNTDAQAAPPRTNLVNGEIFINPIYTGDDGVRDTIYPIKVHVVLTGSYDNANAADNIITFALDPAFILPNTPVILDPVHAITPAQWASGSVTITFALEVSSMSMRLTTDQIGHIIITGQPSSFLSVKLLKDEATKLSKYSGKNYWIETGTNMDFIDGPKLNNLTAGIFFQEIDNRFGDKKQKKWSFFAGAYESKVISDINSLPLTSAGYVNDHSFSSGKPDTITTYRYVGQQKQTTTVRNWSFFLSPALRITSGNARDSNFHLFISFWAELRYQEVQKKLDNSSLILIDSAFDALKNLGQYKQANDTTMKAGFFSHYYGFGLPFYYEDKSVQLLINPVMGLTNQPSFASDSALQKLQEGNPNWHPFYFVQFRLSDNVFGITVTGELRGLLKRFSPPAYTIALTKKFNLDRLLHYN